MANERVTVSWPAVPGAIGYRLERRAPAWPEPGAAVPREWWEGYRRVYRDDVMASRDVSPQVEAALTRVDEDGQPQPARWGRWYPPGAWFRLQ